MITTVSHRSDKEEEWEFQASVPIIEDIKLPSFDIASCITSTSSKEVAEDDEEIALTAVSDTKVINYDQE